MPPLPRAVASGLRAAFVAAAGLAAIGSAGPARADADGPLGAAAVAHAGAVVLGDDATAVARNPAALARRSTLRLQLGLALHSGGLTFASSEAFAAPAPPVEDAAPTAVVPWGGAAVGLGEHVVVGAAVLAPTRFELTDPLLTRAYDPMADDRQIAAGRYAGAHLDLERWAGGPAVAVRILPWAAVGVAALAVHTHLESARVLSAASSGAQLADLSPAEDLIFAPSADGWSPMGTAGLVVAPPDWPLELGAAVAWRGSARLEGTFPMAQGRGTSTPGTPLATLGNGSPTAPATLDLDAETTLRAGARLVASRFAVEVDGEIVLRGGGTPTWQLDGSRLMASGGEAVAVAAVPLGPTWADSFAVRGAVDVEIAPGFLTLCAGYAFSSAAQTAGSLTPTAPFTATHTLAAGLAARVDSARITFGVAHDFRVSATNAPGDARVIAPFLVTEPGQAPAAAAGSLTSGATVVALDVELELL